MGGEYAQRMLGKSEGGSMLTRGGAGIYPDNSSRGFTLIELMITIALLAVLMMIAMPEMRTYMLNSNIRRTAESFVADVMAARAEAIRTNDPVTFTVTDTENPSTAVKSSDLNANENGPNWAAFVVPVNPTPENKERLLLVKRNAWDKDKKGAMVNMHKGEGVSRFTFDGLGRISGWAVFQFTKDEYNQRCELKDKSIRCLQVEISPNGSVHMCEPGREKGKDTRACKK